MLRDPGRFKHPLVYKADLLNFVRTFLQLTAHLAIVGFHPRRDGRA